MSVDKNDKNLDNSGNPNNMNNDKNDRISETGEIEQIGFEGVLLSEEEKPKKKKTAKPKKDISSKAKAVPTDEPIKTVKEETALPVSIDIPSVTDVTGKIEKVSEKIDTSEPLSASSVDEKLEDEYTETSDSYEESPQDYDDSVEIDSGFDEENISIKPLADGVVPVLQDDYTYTDEIDTVSEELPDIDMHRNIEISSELLLGKTSEIERAVEEVQTTGGKPISGFSKSLFEWAEELSIALVFVVCLFTFLFRVITVDGPSMQPNYYDGDRVLISSLKGDLELGDVVIVTNVYDGPIIKRVIATEGQTIDIKESTGAVVVNGEEINNTNFNVENGITQPAWANREGLEFPQTVPKGCVFVLGDNRTASLDSRYTSIGMIDERNVLGKAILNLLPFDKFGKPI